MLLYCNRSFWRVVLQRHGSIFLRRDISMCSLVLACAAATLQYLIDTESIVAPDLPHHYGMHALGVVVAFAVVFRTNLGWQRYWESVTQLHFMYSKWADAYTQMYAFAQVTIEQTELKGGDGAADKVGRVRAILESLERNFGILSALSADRLAHGDLQRMEKRMEMSRWREQIILRKDLRGHDITGATNLPEFMKRKRTSTQRTHQPLGQEWQMTYVVKEVPSEGEMKALHQSTDRVNMVMYWIVHGLAAISKDLDIAPPIQSRMYQELSNGMLGFSNCMKIADVPFPFPYAQLLTYILVVYACFIPVYITCFTKSMIAGPMLTFLLFQGIWGVNEVAKEIENPFGTDVNDISLADFHARFIDVLAEINMGSEAKQMMKDRSVNGRASSSSQVSERDGKRGSAEELIAATEKAVQGKLRKLGRFLTVRYKKKRRDGSTSSTISREVLDPDTGGNVAINVDVVPGDVSADKSDISAGDTMQGVGVEFPPIGQERTPLEGLPSMDVKVRPSSGFASNCEVPETRTPDPQPPSPIAIRESSVKSSGAASSRDPAADGSCLASAGFETPPPIVAEGRSAENPKKMLKVVTSLDEETGTRPGTPASQASGGLMTVVDEHLAQIGASMERHLAQIAKELQIISGMQLQLHPHLQTQLRTSL
mmetsp:Transcript_46258/g.82131  ORF Transcript_46258/g.82131 Transcript_46258/m.82131 type:complete len:655 (-) Transcript_46258:112-2076(-)